MCTISDKPILCTCNIEGELPDNYWCYYTPSKTTYLSMGEVIHPFSIEAENDEQNIATLIMQLNSDDCFDSPVNPQKSDRISLHFSCGLRARGISRLEYAFEYNGRHG